MCPSTGSRVSDDIISREAIKAPSGSPPPSALARTRMSGVTLYLKSEKRLPVRPNPVCTSSNISMAPCLQHALRSPARKLSSGCTTPASACTGSTRTAAVLLLIICTASWLLNSAMVVAGMSGLKAFRYSSEPCTLRAPVVDPWYALRK